MCLFGSDIISVLSWLIALHQKLCIPGGILGRSHVSSFVSPHSCCNSSGFLVNIVIYKLKKKYFLSKKKKNTKWSPGSEVRLLTVRVARSHHQSSVPKRLLCAQVEDDGLRVWGLLQVSEFWNHAKHLKTQLQKCWDHCDVLRSGWVERKAHTCAAQVLCSANWGLQWRIRLLPHYHPIQITRNTPKRKKTHNSEPKNKSKISDRQTLWGIPNREGEIGVRLRWRRTEETVTQDDREQRWFQETSRKFPFVNEMCKK
jgi:hypothetical protein